MSAYSVSDILHAKSQLNLTTIKESRDRKTDPEGACLQKSLQPPEVQILDES